MEANRNSTPSGMTQRPSSAERRAAQLASISTRQADLKREAAERQAQRDLKSKAGGGPTRPNATTRRTGAR